jgi:hypothetical protein
LWAIHTILQNICIEKYEAVTLYLLLKTISDIIRTILFIYPRNQIRYYMYNTVYTSEKPNQILYVQHCLYIWETKSDIICTTLFIQPITTVNCNRQYNNVFTLLFIVLLGYIIEIWEDVTYTSMGYVDAQMSTLFLVVWMTRTLFVLHLNHLSRCCVPNLNVLKKYCSFTTYFHNSVIARRRTTWLMFWS